MMENKDLIWVYNYKKAYSLLMVFTVLWIFFVVYDYTIIIQRPSILYQPIWMFQKIFMPHPVSNVLFYVVAVSSLALSIYNIYKKNIISSLLLFLGVLWLNAIKWNYGCTSAVGHTFVLAHLFSIIVPSFSFLSKKLNIYDSYSVKVSLIGVLVTYSMAGFWKFLSLAKTIYTKNFDQVSWLHSDAVELNAIVGRRSLDNTVSEFMFNAYQIPYFWEVATVLVFAVQLTAVLAVFSRVYASFVLLILVCFHLFNTFFNDVVFNVAPAVLLILLFPYHTFFKKDYLAFKDNLVR